MEPSYGLWCQERPPYIMSHPHAHGDVEWNYLTTGSVLYHLAGQSFSMPQRRLCLFWAGLPHRLHQAGPDATMFVGVLPIGRFLAWQLPSQVLDRLTRGELLLGPVDDHGDDHRMLQRWSAQLAAQNHTTSDLALLDMRARFARLCADHLDSAGAASSTVTNLVGIITTRYAEPLDMPTIAAAAGLHPKYAQTAFRRHTGQTPWQFLQAYRCAQAQRLLLDGDITIPAIADQVGFGSAATFHRVFRQHHGCSPGRWRKQARNPA